MDADESIPHAAVREVMEETAIQADVSTGYIYIYTLLVKLLSKVALSDNPKKKCVKMLTSTSMHLIFRGVDGIDSRFVL